MKKVAALTMVLFAGALFLSTEGAAQEKEKTLKGTITCAKCDLKVEKKCATVIVVKKGDKETVYYFDPAGHKKNHSDICQTPKQGSVTGTVSKKGDKNIITVKDVKFD